MVVVFEGFDCDVECLIEELVRLFVFDEVCEGMLVFLQKCLFCWVQLVMMWVVDQVCWVFVYDVGGWEQFILNYFVVWIYRW